MLNQIEVYRQIPHFREAINGFIEETKGRLADCQDTIKRLNSMRRDPITKHREECMRLKYSARLKHSEAALQALRNLQGCIDE